MQLLSHPKPKLDSKGILGGFIGAIGFGLLAGQLTRLTGVEISSDDLEGTVDHAKFVWAERAALLGLVSTFVGLWGNWVRTTRIAWNEHGKNPLKSKGVMGNLGGFLAAGFVFVQAVSADWEQLRQLFGKGQESWEIVAPAVMAIIGTVQGIWGRWRATRRVENAGANDDLARKNPMAVLFLVPALFGGSCATAPEGAFGPQNPLPESRADDPDHYKDLGYREEVNFWDRYVTEGAVATAGLALLRTIEISGSMEDSKACVHATLFGFGPQICLGIRTPDPSHPPLAPPDPSQGLGAQRVDDAEREFSKQ